MPRSKFGGGDFKNRKAKVGRRLATANVTDTSFKAATLRISNAADAAAAVSKGAGTASDQLLDLLSQTRHHNPSTRQDVSVKLGLFVGAHFAIVADSVGLMVEALGERLLDPEPGVRGAVLTCWDALCRRLPPRQLQPFMPRFLSFVRAALTQIAPPVRLDGVVAVASCWHHAPELRCALASGVSQPIADLLDPALYPLIVASHIHHAAPAGLAIAVAGGGGGGGAGVGRAVAYVDHPTVEGSGASGAGEWVKPPLVMRAAKATAVDARIVVAHVLGKLLAPSPTASPVAGSVHEMWPPTDATGQAARAMSAMDALQEAGQLGPRWHGTPTTAPTTPSSAVSHRLPDRLAARVVHHCLQLWQMTLSCEVDRDTTPPVLMRHAALADCISSLVNGGGVPWLESGAGGVHASLAHLSAFDAVRGAEWANISRLLDAATMADVAVPLTASDSATTPTTPEACAPTRLRQLVFSAIARIALPRFPAAAVASAEHTTADAGRRPTTGGEADAAAATFNLSLARLALACCPAHCPAEVAEAAHHARSASAGDHAPSGGADDGGDSGDVTTNPFAALRRPRRPKPADLTQLAAAPEEDGREPRAATGSKRRRDDVDDDHDSASTDPSAQAEGASKRRRDEAAGDAGLSASPALLPPPPVALALVSVYEGAVKRAQGVAEWLQAHLSASFHAVEEGGRPSASVGVDRHPQHLVSALNLVSILQRYAGGTLPHLNVHPLLETVSRITRALPPKHPAQCLFAAETTRVLAEHVQHHGAAAVLAVPLFSSWFQRIPKLLWGTDATQHGDVCATMLTVLHTVARQASASSPSVAAATRDAVRQLTPVLYGVKAGADALHSTAAPSGVFGPFMRWPADLQRRLLALLRLAGALTPPLRRALCACIVAADTEAGTADVGDLTFTLLAC